MKKAFFSGRAVTITIASMQFTIYAVFGMIAFAVWIITITTPLGNGYVSGHLIRWTAKLPIWGPIILSTGVLSWVAADLLWKSRRLGGYLGTLSFSVGFATNLVVARNLLVHAFVGALVGWILLVPLIAGWKTLN